jgi:ferric-dicitrate binding protein FerR (iron transport regulator)
MEHTEQYDALLIRYLLNELPAAAEKEVVEWINASKENRLYFEKLKEVWQLTGIKQSADKIDVHQEWEQFKQRLAVNNPEAVSSDYMDEDAPPNSGILYRIWVRAAVAASVLLVIGMVGYYLSNQKPKRQEIAQNNKEKVNPVLVSVKHMVNTTGQPMEVQLQDGSVVTLSDKSEISYQEPFITRRDITLTGEAHFKVAKDAATPFAVYSGVLSTTALGTEFSVTAFAKAENIKVRLYEGKVVIKPADSMDTKWEKDIYLLPGQELVYDNKTMTTVIRPFRMNKPTVADGNNNSDTYSKDATWYMFNNQSLAQVFDQLEEMYGVEIIYLKRDVQNMYFIGKFNKSDSVENVLKQIGTLNNLKVIKKKNQFIITK